MKLENKDLRQLKAHAWKLMKKVIQKRDFDWRGQVKCATCTNRLEINTKNAQAGHYLHGVTKMSYFDLRNVHYQCISCNHFGGSKMGIMYERFMQLKYGQKVIDELDKLSGDPKTWTKKRLLDKIKEFEELLK